jgi:hypothetical protein
VQAEAADEVSSAFPEGQTVAGVAVDGVSSVHLVVDFVEEAVVVGMYALGSGRTSRRGALEAVLGVADIEVEEGVVGSKDAVTVLAWAEA